MVEARIIDHIDCVIYERKERAGVLTEQRGGEWRHERKSVPADAQHSQQT